MTEVVAALVWREGRFMICQRPAHKARGLLWEFVGGKTEPGETGEEALVRECREELDITVTPGAVFTDVTHVYPDLTVHLTLYHCTIAEGEPKLLEHEVIAWITPDEIGNYDFCPADVEILEKIREEYGNQSL
ncbi:MAG: (deoxy)nucleoside triphosphate pyrophosphohydrolase [Clostridia bacterium]|nr:(deoxy)nucleoside triphosphate pyrophosphohydrolase [Clostridia bacterium]